MQLRLRSGMSMVRVLPVLLVLLVMGFAIYSISTDIVSVSQVAKTLGLQSITNTAAVGGMRVGDDLRRGQGDGVLNIIAVPYIYGNKSETQWRYDNFKKYMSRLERNLATKTPFEEAGKPADHVSIDRLLPAEPDRGTGGEVNSDPSPSGSFTVDVSHVTEPVKYTRISCSTIFTDAREEVRDEGLMTSIDRILVWVNGTSSSKVVSIGDAALAGCTNGIGGDISAVERSLIQNRETIGVALHELGHGFGLCHNNGVPSSGSCDTSRAPPRPSVCASRNSPASDGPSAIMNYCMPLYTFSGEMASVEDEFTVLRKQFINAGWLYTK